MCVCHRHEGMTSSSFRVFKMQEKLVNDNVHILYELAKNLERMSLGFRIECDNHLTFIDIVELVSTLADKDTK